MVNSLNRDGYDLRTFPIDPKYNNDDHVIESCKGKVHYKEDTTEENAIGSMMPQVPLDNPIITKQGTSIETNEPSDSDNIEEIEENNDTQGDTLSTVEKEKNEKFEMVRESKIFSEKYKDTPMYPKYLHEYEEAVNAYRGFCYDHNLFMEDDVENPVDTESDGTDEVPPPEESVTSGEETPEDTDSVEEPTDEENDESSDSNETNDDTEEEDDPSEPDVDKNDYKNSIRAKSLKKSLENAETRMEKATDPVLKKRYKVEYEQLKEEEKLYNSRSKKDQKDEAEASKNIKEDTDMGYIDDMSELFQESSIFTEAADIASEMKPIIKSLNNKGYKTKYSSPGYEKSRSKTDVKRDGIKNAKLYSTARIMFDGDYNFPPAPEGWLWRQVDKKDYLDVKEKSFNYDNGTSADSQFDEWKKDYMASLKSWVSELPDAGAKRGDSSENPDDDEKKVEESTSVMESFNTMMIDTFGI